MKSINLFLVLILFIPITVFSQSIESNEYNRNSIAIITVKNKKWNKEIVSASSNYDYSKFDINEIDSKELKLDGLSPNGDRAKFIDSLVENSDLGKEVISYWFGRKANGEMNVDRVAKRAVYNANDADYDNSIASKRGTAMIEDMGFDLVKSSYIFVIDNPRIEYSRKNKSYDINSVLYVFRVEYTQEIEASIFETWINESDTPKVRDHKNKCFNNIKIPLKLVYTTKNASSSSDINLAFKYIYDGLFYNLEKDMESMAVGSYIENVNPITAKIGTKEGLKNGRRYFAYKYKEGRDGELKKVKKGVLRATVIADNKNTDLGKTPESSFYQIAGGTLREGYSILQKNDIALGVSLGYRYGGYEGYALKFDKLLSINKSGGSNYLLFDFTGNYYTHIKPLSENKSYFTSVSVEVGYGYGIRFARIFEIMPIIKFGADMLFDTQEEDKELNQGYAYMVMPELRLNMNLAYPLQFMVGVDYGIPFAYEKNYKEILDYVETSKGRKRKGMGLSAGLKYIF
ncbi:MAG: hypothetical protein IMY73_00020 [Bacteroidetes bacterium]|nr:hypothetical protein [Bacteroidota bacterium]